VHKNMHMALSLISLWYDIVNNLDSAFFCRW